MRSYKFFVSGRVQGVYYRANVSKNAQEAGFNGYVKNLDDGRVEAGVTCDEAGLVRFKKILQKGSVSSQVVAIEVLESSEVFSGPFEVRT